MPTSQPRATVNTGPPPQHGLRRSLSGSHAGRHREGHSNLGGLPRAGKRNGGWELMTPNCKVAMEGKPERCWSPTQSCLRPAPVFTRGRITAPLRLRGLYGFSKHFPSIIEKCSLRGQHKGFGSESHCGLAPLAATASRWEGPGLVAAGRLPLGWPLPMAPAESFEVVREKKTKARNKGTECSFCSEPPGIALG